LLDCFSTYYFLCWFILLFYRSNDGKPYIQVNFLEPKTLTGVTIQGHGKLPMYVTSFRVETSNDGKIFQPYSDSRTNKTASKLFDGNKDSVTPVSYLFNRKVAAQFIRIYPVGFSGLPAMKFNIMGCNPSLPKPTIAPPTDSQGRPILHPNINQTGMPTLNPPTDSQGRPILHPNTNQTGMPTLKPPTGGQGPIIIPTAGSYVPPPKGMSQSINSFFSYDYILSMEGF